MMNVLSGTIRCSCELLWLVRDQPQLLPFIDSDCRDMNTFRTFNIKNWNWGDLYCPNQSNALQPITCATSITLMLFVWLITKLLWCRRGSSIYFKTLQCDNILWFLIFFKIWCFRAIKSREENVFILYWYNTN